MSHAALDGAPKGVFTRAIQAMCLGLLFALLWLATRAVPEAHSRVGTIAAVGFLLLAGTLTSELVEVIGLPHLTGYLLAGIVAGPHVLRLIDEESVQDLSQVNALALALIALEGGAHLRAGALRKGARSLAWATLTQHVLVLVTMTGVFMGLRAYIPFAASLGTSALLGCGLLWGVLAVTRSPAATLGILSQTRARGPIMDGTLSFVMTSDLIVVILLAAAMAVARPLLDPTATFSLADFQALGHEIVGSVSLGTTLGLILAAYLRLVGTQLIVVFIALGFGMTSMLQFLHFEPLLAFMVAGFAVQNLSKQGEKFLAGAEQAGSLVYVVFFATAGAHLDLPLLARLWPIALALAGTRALATWIASRSASRLAGDGPVLRRWGFAGLISQAGLALGVSTLIERAFPALGNGFRVLTLATVALNEMVGPVLFKFALDRAGETSREASPSLHSIPPPA